MIIFLALSFWSKLLLFHRLEETKREVKLSAMFVIEYGDRRKLFACSNLFFAFLFGWEACFCILHIKAIVSDVQDIVKYLPVMPGRQYLLIQLLSIHCFCNISVLIPLSLSISVCPHFFLLKRIFYHHVHYFTPIAPLLWSLCRLVKILMICS